MNTKAKMQRWQVTTLVVLFLLAIASIISFNVFFRHDNDEVAQQPIETSANIETSYAPIEKISPTPIPTQAVATPDATSPAAGTDKYTNGVTVQTDGANNQTITRDWSSTATTPQPTASSAPATPSASVSGSGKATTSSGTTAATGKSGSASGSTTKSSSGSTSSGTNSSGSSTPKNGATKTEGGEVYTYLEGFGWVKGQLAPAQSIQGTGPGTSGVHIGSMG